MKVGKGMLQFLPPQMNCGSTGLPRAAINCRVAYADCWTGGQGTINPRHRHRPSARDRTEHLSRAHEVCIDTGQTTNAKPATRSPAKPRDASYDISLPDRLQRV